jgi:radical SAM superfamily enzyme YgiQ (UPF0313 family)
MSNLRNKIPMKILYLPNEYSQQRQREKKVNIYPILLAMEAEWYRRQTEHRVDWGFTPITQNLVEGGYYDKVITEPEGLPFLSLPHPDRVFTRAMDKKYQSCGNYKYTPGTHIMSASGCWWGKCTFCVENKGVAGRHGVRVGVDRDLPQAMNNPPLPSYLVRPVDSVIEEIGECIDLKFREAFDDSATFPLGVWTLKFCEEMIKKGYNEKIKIGCNMRLDYNHPNLNGLKYMKHAGFRMVLYGLESGNQATLDRLNKGINIESAIDNIKRSAKAGLSVHLAIMTGYPWETREDAMRTINLVKQLLIKGYAQTAQCSFYTPPNHEGDYRQKDLVRKIYEVGYSPEFWWNRIIQIRSMADLRYLWLGIQKALK